MTKIHLTDGQTITTTADFDEVVKGFNTSGWRITNPAEHYRTAVNFCPMCGRDLRSDGK